MRALLLAGAGAFGWAGAVLAAPITAIYDFTATFSYGPNTTVSGTISLTYDPTADGSAVVNSFASSVLGSYTPVTAYRSHNGYTIFGTNITSQGGYSIFSGRNQFADAFLTDESGNARSNGSLSYAQSGVSGVFGSGSQTVTREAATAVPEPASLVLLSMGVVGTAAVKRHRVG